MALTVLAPASGRVVPLTAVPDPVFADLLVGAGAAIEPLHRGPVAAIAPVSGTVSRLHPHAFVVRTDSGAAVFVHLGIDTVQLGGTGFEQRVSENDLVAAGSPVVSWNPAQVAATGRSPMCVVVALGAGSEALTGPIAGADVEIGGTLFTWDRWDART